MPSKRIKSLLPKGHYYFSGNEAAAEGALAAGCRFYAGYPITPSSETHGAPVPAPARGGRGIYPDGR